MVIDLLSNSVSEKVHNVFKKKKGWLTCAPD